MKFSKSDHGFGYVARNILIIQQLLNLNEQLESMVKTDELWNRCTAIRRKVRWISSKWGLTYYGGSSVFKGVSIRFNRKWYCSMGVTCCEASQCDIGAYS